MKKSSSQTKNIVSKKSWYVAVGLVTVLLLLGQVLFDFYVYKYGLIRQDNDRITLMITDAMRNMSKPAVVEPVSKKVYFPDASMVLPPYPSNVNDIRYGYTLTDDKDESILQITTMNALQSGISRIMNEGQMTGYGHKDNLTAMFNEVPSAQACSRGVFVSVNQLQESADGALLETKTLKDGRTVRIYGNQRCATYNFSSLASYIKAIDSY